MLADELQTFETWHLDLPSLPERTRLYYLEPIAIDTAYVESLTSYICRLAEAHCVSPNILIHQEILPSLRRTYTIGSKEIYKVRKDADLVTVSSFPKPVHSRNPNQQGFQAWQFIEGLQPLTFRSNLQSLTIPLRENKTPKRLKVARDIRAWCPECFQQARLSNRVIYEQLLWAIAAVTVCPHHQLPLQSRCPNCQKTQRPLTGKMQVGRCSQCFNWLVLRSQELSETERLILQEIDWHLWVAQRVGEILEIESPHILSPGIRELIAHAIYDTGKPRPTVSENATVHQIQWELLKTLIL